MFGRPGGLTEGAATTVTIATEPLAGARHDVHFNRGAIASQAFARHFPGQTLDQAGAPAYEWLGRDLLPALLGFIAKAKDDGSACTPPCTSCTPPASNPGPTCWRHCAPRIWPARR